MTQCCVGGPPIGRLLIRVEQALGKACSRSPEVSGAEPAGALRAQTLRDACAFGLRLEPIGPFFDHEAIVTSEGGRP